MYGISPYGHRFQLAMKAGDFLLFVVSMKPGMALAVTIFEISSEQSQIFRVCCGRDLVSNRELSIDVLFACSQRYADIFVIRTLLGSLLTHKSNSGPDTSCCKCSPKRALRTPPPYVPLPRPQPSLVNPSLTHLVSFPRHPPPFLRQPSTGAESPPPSDAPPAPPPAPASSPSD